MKDYSDATFWAISSLGYGRGYDVQEAVTNHDRIVSRDYRDMLNRPVGEIPMLVWERAADGFVLDSQVRWETDGKYVGSDVDSECRAARAQQDRFWEYVKENDLQVEVV